MPRLRSAVVSPVQFVYAADLHLGSKPPIARSGEDWIEAQRRTLRQVSRLCEEHDCPLVLGGDVFHKWAEPAEIINMALEWLDDVPDRLTFGVAGNHDLKNHNLADIDKTALGTLIRANRMHLLEPNGVVSIKQVRLHGFSWGVEPTPPKDPHSLSLDIAVIHAYCFNKRTAHPGANPEESVLSWARRLKGYNLALMGDQHTTIHYKTDGFELFNPGSLMRRNADQKNHRPCVGLVMSDGTVDPVYLDCSKDVLEEGTPQSKPDAPDAGAFLNELESLGEIGIDFRASMDRWVAANPVSTRAKALINAAMEERK